MNTDIKWIGFSSFATPITYKNIEVQSVARVFGNLTYEYGDNFVTDKLNNVKWMRFSANEAYQSKSDLLAMFSDINSEFYGYKIADSTYADKLLETAFGLTNQYNNLNKVSAVRQIFLLVLMVLASGW